MKNVSRTRQFLSACGCFMFLFMLTSYFYSAPVYGQVLKFKGYNLGNQAGVEYVDVMQFSADNRFAYTASYSGFAVFDFDATSGKLALKQLHNMEDYGFSDRTGNNIVFSHDEKFAYASAAFSKNLFLFERDATTGMLTYLSTIEDVTDQFNERSVITISPDDQFLYTGGTVFNTYRRNPVDGTLTRVARQTNGFESGEIHISPDGSRMYMMTAYMRVFNRNVSTGAVSLLEEHYEWGSTLNGISYSAITPDGKFLFAGTRYNGIARFSIAANGSLTFLGFFNYPRPGDVIHPLGPLSVNAVAINSAGTRLYASSYGNLTSYEIDGTGKLTLLDKVTVTGSNTPYYGLTMNKTTEHIFAFGSSIRETAVECFKENSSNKLESLRTHYFNDSLDKGLSRISAEALSADDQYLYTASSGDRCVTAFHSGITNGGQLSEINRISYQNLMLPSDGYITELLVSTDGKSIYLRISKNVAPYTSSIVVVDVASNGEISYRSQFTLPAIITDLHLDPNDRYLYVASNDNVLSIYQRETTGDLTLQQKLTTTEMGVYWLPASLMMNTDGSLLFVRCSRLNQNQPHRLFQFNRNTNNGVLTLLKTSDLLSANKMILREEQGMFYQVSEYGASVISYTWNPVTGDLVSKQNSGAPGNSNGEWAGMIPGNDLLAVNDSEQTRFFGFYADGIAVYNSSEIKHSVVSYSSGGSESGQERFLFPRSGNLIYAIRPYGNGIYLYEFNRNEFPPLPPTGVNATVSEGVVTVTWNASPEPDVVGYEIYRDYYGNITPGNGTMKVGQSNTTRFTDATVSMNTGYYYWVKAITATKASYYSTLSPGVYVTNPAPAVPSSVAIQRGDKFLKLTWAANTETDFKNYVVYRNTSNSLSGASERITTTVTTFTDEAVNYGQNYFYWIKAVDLNLSQSAASSVVSGIPVDNPPATPSGLQLHAGDRYIELTWSASIEGDFKNYIIYRNTSNSINGAVELITTTTSFRDENVSYGQTYFYWIKAIDLNLNVSAFSNSVSTMPVDSPPAKPAGLSVQPGDRYIQLTWLANTEADMEHYVVYRNTASNIGSAMQLYTTTATTYKDESVDYGQQYYYWIKAVDKRSNPSSESDAVSTVLVDMRPAPPTVLNIVAGDRFLQLKWNINTSFDQLTFEVFKGDLEGISNAVLFKTQVTNEVTDTEVQYLHQYYYYVRAMDKNGNRSPFSTVMTGMPIDSPPSSPTGLKATSTNAGVYIQWNRNSESDLKGYRLYFANDDMSANATEIAVRGKEDIDFTYPAMEGKFYFWLKAFDNNQNLSAASAAAHLIITAVEQAADRKPAIYPNPAGNEFYIHTEEVSCTYTLYSMQGIAVAGGIVKSNQSIDVSGIAAGSYLCKVNYPGKSYLLRFVKL